MEWTRTCSSWSGRRTGTTDSSTDSVWAWGLDLMIQGPRVLPCVWRLVCAVRRGLVSVSGVELCLCRVSGLEDSRFDPHLPVAQHIETTGSDRRTRWIRRVLVHILFFFKKDLC